MGQMNSSLDFAILSYFKIRNVQSCNYMALIYYDLLAKCSVTQKTWPRGYKKKFMLNSVEHGIFPAHKC